MAEIGNSNTHNAGIIATWTAGFVDSVYDDVTMPSRVTIIHNGDDYGTTFRAGFAGVTYHLVTNMLSDMDAARGDSLGEIVVHKESVNGLAFSPRGAWENYLAALIARYELLGVDPNVVIVRMGANDQNAGDDPNDLLVALREFRYTWRSHFPNCRIIIIGAEEGTPVENYAWNDEVNALAQQFADETPNCVYRSTIGLAHADGIHLSYIGQHDLADSIRPVITAEP